MSDGNSDWIVNFDEDGREYLTNIKTGEVKGFRFGMMSVKSIPSIRTLIKKKAIAAELLFFLIENMSMKNMVKMSKVKISEISGLSKSSIERGMKCLIECGFVKKKIDDGQSIFIINDRIFWRSSQASRKSSAFTKEIDLKPLVK